MKLKFIFLLLVSIIVLSGCDTSKPKSEYDKFTELFEETVDKLDESTSIRVDENCSYDYTVNDSKINASLISYTEAIADPYYAKAYMQIKTTLEDFPQQNMNIKTDILVLQDEEDYKMYTKLQGILTSETISKEEFEEETENVILDATLYRLPESVEKVKEEKVNEDTHLTYETTFTIGDLEDDYKSMFDQLFTIFIGEDVKGTDYANIEIKQRIEINVSKKELVSVTYDVNEILTKATQDYMDEITGVESEIAGTKGEYEIIFSQRNNVVKDTDFIEEMS